MRGLLALIVCFAIGWCSVSVSAVDADDPAAELASFQVADGFQVNLFASEKEGVMKPIQMRFDARGRLWVIGSTVYPQIKPGETPNDKVLILEDTDGNGRCDKTTVFADGLMIPTGIEIGYGGVYVGQGSELLFLRDTSGHDRADERRVVLRGFGTGDNHQVINSFLWGPGGEMWMSQGLHIRSRVETPWGTVRVDQAGLWRLWPRRLQLDGFYGSANEPQNPWGFVFTEWGEPIVLAGNNSSPIYPVPGLVPHHRDAPPSLIWKGGNGRKVSGGDIVGTKHFPDSWQGALILGGYINNAVWVLKISDNGAGFSLTDLPPLIKSSDRSFRPVDVKFGPDGALYLCDWYNPIIGHYQASFRHPDRDKIHGRIWRVTAKGRPLTKAPQLADASIGQLLDQLESPDRWTRHFAKRVLADRSSEQVTAGLRAWTTKPGASERALVEALGVYQDHEVVASDLLERLCHATDPGARAYAASVVGAWAGRLPDPLALLRPLVADNDPRVRLHAVVACTYVHKPEAMLTAALAADFATDRFLDYALNQAVYSLRPYWLEAFKTGKLELKPAGLSLLIRGDGTPDTLEAVRSLLHASQLDPITRESYLRILAETGEAADIAAILRLPDAALLARLLPTITTLALIRSVRPDGDLPALMRPIVWSQQIELRAEGLKLASAWKIEVLRPIVEEFALNPDADEKTRRSAIEGLGFFGGDRSRQALVRLASASAPPVRSSAIAALCSLDLQEAARLASEGFAGIDELRLLDEIFSAFLQRQAGAAALAGALDMKLPPKSAAQAGLRLMSSSGRRDAQLVRVLSRAVGLEGEDRKMTPPEIAAFAAEIRAEGDPKRGKEIFSRPTLGCTACHAVNGQGGTIGPDLSNVGTAQPIDFIIGAILDPQKEVKEGYMSLSVTTKDDQEYLGYEVRQTAEELVLRDLLQGREVRLRSEMIKQKKPHGSVMPSGLTDALTRTEFRDLVRFLSELGKLQLF